MNTEYRNKWLDALTSGEYEQTTGVLGRYEERGQSFCCLGVLCDVLMDDDEAPVTLDKRHFDSDIMSFNDGENGVLPAAVRKFLGFENSIPDYSFDMNTTGEPSWDREATGEFMWIKPYDDRGSYVELSLAGLNDDGLTFTQIADIIRWAEPAE